MGNTKKSKSIDNGEMVQWVVFAMLFLVIAVGVGILLSQLLDNTGVSEHVYDQINEGYWAFALAFFAIFSVSLGLKYASN